MKYASCANRIEQDIDYIEFGYVLDIYDFNAK